MVLDHVRVCPIKDYSKYSHKKYVNLSGYKFELLGKEI